MVSSMLVLLLFALSWAYIARSRETLAVFRELQQKIANTKDPADLYRLHRELTQKPIDQRNLAELERRIAAIFNQTLEKIGRPGDFYDPIWFLYLVLTFEVEPRVEQIKSKIYAAHKSWLGMANDPEFCLMLSNEWNEFLPLTPRINRSSDPFSSESPLAFRLEDLWHKITNELMWKHDELVRAKQASQAKIQQLARERGISGIAEANDARTCWSIWRKLPYKSPEWHKGCERFIQLYNTPRLAEVSASADDNQPSN